MDISEVSEAIRSDLSGACGARIFTVTAIDTENQLARRIYTSHPVEYPVSGTKPINQDEWTRQVVVDQRAFIANSTEEFATYFPDHALINALGCQSALNVPVVDQGRTIATVNILDAEGRFDGPTVDRVMEILDRHRSVLLLAITGRAGED